MKRAADHPSKGSTGDSAFTLVELVLVVAVLSVLLSVALASSHRSNETVFRVQCADNLRQIGVALNKYATEQNGYLPACKYLDTNPWYTYEVARVFPGTDQITQGYMNVGLLFRTGTITDASVLYCPAQTNPHWVYDYYVTTPNGWPSTPAGSGDDNIRTGYSYFPQRRQIEYVGGILPLPRLITSGSVPLEVGSVPGIPPTKLTELNPQKSITTDFVHILDLVPHKTYGELTGLNALFLDGGVTFQNAHTHPDFFDTTLWDGVGNDGLRFRRVMNNWEQ